MRIISLWRKFDIGASLCTRRFGSNNLPVTHQQSQSSSKKVFIVTGANRGIGREIVKGLLREGFEGHRGSFCNRHHVVMACRSTENGVKAASQVMKELAEEIGAPYSVLTSVGQCCSEDIFAERKYNAITAFHMSQNSASALPSNSALATYDRPLLAIVPFDLNDPEVIAAGAKLTHDLFIEEDNDPASLLPPTQRYHVECIIHNAAVSQQILEENAFFTKPHVPMPSQKNPNQQRFEHRSMLFSIMSKINWNRCPEEVAGTDVRRLIRSNFYGTTAATLIYSDRVFFPQTARNVEGQDENGRHIFMVTRKSTGYHIKFNVLRDILLNKKLTLPLLHTAVQQYLALVPGGAHRGYGWPDDPYLASKLLVGVLCRILSNATDFKKRKITSLMCCPGVPYVDTGRLLPKHTRSPKEIKPVSVVQAAVTPLWLALKGNNKTSCFVHQTNEIFFCERTPVDWDGPTLSPCSIVRRPCAYLAEFKEQMHMRNAQYNRTKISPLIKKGLPSRHYR